MFEYDLTEKQVVLVLNQELLASLAVFGIHGSPLLARVHKMEESGLWLENPAFPVCAPGAKRIYGPEGEPHCTAYIFVPAQAIFSVAVFPAEVKDIENNPNFHKIGFSIGLK